MVESSTEISALIICTKCGSLRIRRSRARTRAEMLVRALTPLHFHICRDCGKRGWHLGGARVPLTESERRHAESGRSNPGDRVLLRWWYVVALVACLLGVALGFWLRGCDSKPLPPASLEPLD